MISITPPAAEQIRRSVEQSSAQGLSLRIAVRLDDNGAIEYGMGFDEKTDNDMQVVSEGVDLLISPGSKELLMGATLDYVEINPGEFQFIFINPNDPTHTVPKRES
jgi:iron-sulfur cluster assembly protein